MFVSGIITDIERRFFKFGKYEKENYTAYKQVYGMEGLSKT